MDFNSLLLLPDTQRNSTVSELSLDDTAQYMQFLSKQLRVYSDAYYQGSPLITDAEFDVYFDELVALEKKYPDYIDTNSPTQRVGATTSKTIQHYEKMYSLDKDMNSEELEQSLRSLENKLGKPLEYSCELKNDGLSISLIYKDGILTGALTRGDGESGEDVFTMVSHMSLVPKVIPTKGLAEIRGEIFMTYSDFQAYNKKLIARGEEPKSNTRNLAVGTLKSLDPAVLQERPLSLVIYTFGRVDDPVFKATVFSQKDFLEWAASVGFPTDPHNYIASGIDDAIAYCERAEQLRSTLNYQIDGVVVTLNSFADRAHPDMGFTERVPRFGRAFKFPPEKKITKVIAITWNGPSRTGRFTPVAEVEPTVIGGVTVRFVTLDNYDKISELGVAVGSEVTLVRSGDVIPKIINVVSDRGSNYTPALYSTLPGATTPPSHCPDCGGDVNRTIDEKGVISAVYTCDNEDCPARFYGQLEAYVGKDRGLDIDGFGTVWVERLVESKMVTRFSDIFTLTKDQLLQFDRTGEKTVTNLLSAISAAKKQKWSRVLASFQIPDCGNTTSRLLSETYPDYASLKIAIADASSRLLSASDFEIEFAKMKSEKSGIAGIESIGYKTMRSLITYFSKPEHVVEIERVLSFLEVEKTAPKNNSLPFSGKVFCVTGNVSAFVPDVVLELAGKPGLKGKEITDRPTFELLLQTLGGEVKSSVTKNLTTLVRGFDGGALIGGLKVVNAEKANTQKPGAIEFWNEDSRDLEKKLQEAGNRLLLDKTHDNDKNDKTPPSSVKTIDSLNGDMLDDPSADAPVSSTSLIEKSLGYFPEKPYVTSDKKNVWMYSATEPIPKEITDFVYLRNWFNPPTSNSPYHVEPETMAYINALFGDVHAFVEKKYNFDTNVIPAAIAYEIYLADSRGLYDAALATGTMSPEFVQNCRDSAASVFKQLAIQPHDFVVSEPAFIKRIGVEQSPSVTYSKPGVTGLVSSDTISDTAFLVLKEFALKKSQTPSIALTDFVLSYCSNNNINRAHMTEIQDTVRRMSLHSLTHNGVINDSRIANFDTYSDYLAFLKDIQTVAREKNVSSFVGDSVARQVFMERKDKRVDQLEVLIYEAQNSLPEKGVQKKDLQGMITIQSRVYQNETEDNKISLTEERNTGDVKSSVINAGYRIKALPYADQFSLLISTIYGPHNVDVTNGSIALEKGAKVVSFGKVYSTFPTRDQIIDDICLDGILEKLPPKLKIHREDLPSTDIAYIYPTAQEALVTGYASFDGLHVEPFTKENLLSFITTSPSLNDFKKEHLGGVDNSTIPTNSLTTPAIANNIFFWAHSSISFLSDTPVSFDEIAHDSGLREKFELFLLKEVTDSVLEHPHLPSSDAPTAEFTSYLTSIPEATLWIDPQETVWIPVPSEIYSDLISDVMHHGALLITQNVVGDYSVSCNSDLSCTTPGVVWVSPVFQEGDNAGLPLTVSFFRDLIAKREITLNPKETSDTVAHTPEAVQITPIAPVLLNDEHQDKKGDTKATQLNFDF